MKSYDLLDLASRNLRNSKLRNSLTTVGIAVGVASLVAMLSLGIGLQSMATSRIRKSGVFDIVFVTSKQDVRGMRARMQDTDTANARVLDDAARKELEQLPDVAEVTPDIHVVAEIGYGDKSRMSVVVGLPMSEGATDAFDKLQGKFFSNNDADEAVLEEDFAKRLDPNPANLLGKDIVLRYAERQQGDAGASDSQGAGGGFSVTRKEQTLKVVGINSEEPFTGGGPGAHGQVYIPVGTAERLNMMQPFDVRAMVRGDVTGKTYNMLRVRVRDSGQVEQVQNAIKKMGFAAFSVIDALNGLRRFFAIFDAFLGIFGSLALAVASLAIINTLVMAVLERRREIGIMKALGASDTDVKKLFFAEAAVMGIVGGAAGVLFGWLMGRIINFGTGLYMTRMKMAHVDVWYVPWWLVVGAIGFSVLVSLIAGLYPAARAAKLDPIQALRYE